MRGCEKSTDINIICQEKNSIINSVKTHPLIQLTLSIKDITGLKT